VPRRSKREETRQRLLQDGVSSFLEHGYHGTGIKEVLDRVEVPKGSFYNYFESKEAFGAAAIRHYAGCLAAKMESELSEASDPVSGLRCFFERLINRRW
jgi:TetR/AcrR family transcriptional repressor of nem operon